MPNHPVFVSYHADDQEWKDRFVQKGKNVFIDKSVDTGDIDDTDLKVDTIRQRIRDDFIRDATVTIVLIGPCTWQRKHVDWEIGSSLRKSKYNSRCGVLGILLPNHPDYANGSISDRLIPPRLADNRKGDDPYVVIHRWPKHRAEARLSEWIHLAFLRSTGKPPINNRPQFGRNRSGCCADGWRD